MLLVISVFHFVLRRCRPRKADLAALGKTVDEYRKRKERPKQFAEFRKLMRHFEAEGLDADMECNEMQVGAEGEKKSSAKPCDAVLNRPKVSLRRPASSARDNRRTRFLNEAHTFAQKIYEPLENPPAP